MFTKALVPLDSAEVSEAIIPYHARVSDTRSGYHPGACPGALGR